MGNTGKPRAMTRHFQFIPTGWATLSGFFPPFPAQRSAISRNFPPGSKDAYD
jgi:hypothetical protein